MPRAPASTWTAIITGLLLCACQRATDHIGDSRGSVGIAAAQPPQAAQASAREPVTDPGSRKGRTIASPRLPDVTGLTSEQLDAMFDAAVEQARPFGDKAAVCVAMQGLNDRERLDAPAEVISRLSDKLRLPGVPASQCAFGLEPYVIATGAKAMLYSVRIEARDASGVLTFWAMAAYGNLGARGMQFRLVRQGDRWMTVPTGLSVIS